MKITKKQLKAIIQEEIHHEVNENAGRALQDTLGPIIGSIDPQEAVQTTVDTLIQFLEIRADVSLSRDQIIGMTRDALPDAS